jgi:ADP-ribose pyrophosphatase YjhB (NUDIX family)
MTRVRRYRIGVAIATMAVSSALLAAGCGFGGGDDKTSASPSHSVAQVLLLRGGNSSDLQVLLLRHSQKVFFNPGAWVFPTGAVNSADNGEEAARATVVRVLADQAGIEVPASDLVPYAEWVLLGFDTHFYLALAPADAKPTPDGTQTIAARWLSPRRALAWHRAGKLPIAYGAVKQLESLRGFASASDAIDAARSMEVTPVQLRVVGQGKKAHAVLPEDAPQG